MEEEGHMACRDCAAVIRRCLNFWNVGVMCVNCRRAGQVIRSRLGAVDGMLS